MGIGYVLSEMKLIQVSIPSNGSIQFLREIKMDIIDKIKRGLNPLKRVNSILTGFGVPIEVLEDFVSIPSNGSIQFLHYPIIISECQNTVSIPSNGSIQFLRLVQSVTIKRVGYLSQSPQTGQFNSYIHTEILM